MLREFVVNLEKICYWYNSYQERMSYLISLFVFSSPVILLSEKGILLEGVLSASLIVNTISPKFCAESRSVALT